MLRLLSPLAVIAFGLCGCAGPEATVLREYPALEADAPVDVLIDVPADGRYIEVAYLHADADGPIYDDRASREVIEELREAARDVGAHAIILRRSDGTGYDWGNARTPQQRADAIAIRYQ